MYTSYLVREKYYKDVDMTGLPNTVKFFSNDEGLSNDDLLKLLETNDLVYGECWNRLRDLGSTATFSCNSHV